MLQIHVWLEDSAMANRCTRITQAGSGCSIFSTSNITTDGAGLDHCLFHCVPFETHLAEPDLDRRCGLVILDLEMVPCAELESLLAVLDLKLVQTFSPDGR